MTKLTDLVPGKMYEVTFRTSLHTGRQVTRKLRYERTLPSQYTGPVHFFQSLRAGSYPVSFVTRAFVSAVAL